MILAQAQAELATQGSLSAQQRPAERRRHQRVPVNLLGRYMLSDRQEYPCQIINMSPGGVAMIAPVKGTEQERVVCYIDHLGRVEGVVARVFESGFAIQMNVPLTKREKLAEQLTWLANRNVLGIPEDRRHDRVVPRVTASFINMQDGSSYPVRLIDISPSGAAMNCDARPKIGTALTVGKTPARVVRVSASGIAVEFLRMVPFELFDESVVL